MSRRSPGASGSGLGFSNGLKQAELENPAPDKLRGDYHGKNKIFIVVGERISFKPKAGKRKAGTEEPAKLYGRVDSLVANSMISVTFDDGSKRSLRKSRVVHEAPAAGLEKEEDDSSDNDDDDDDEVPGDDDDEEDAEAADFADVDSATAADAEETAAGDKHAAKAAAADAVIAAKLGEVVEKSGTILSKKVTAKWTVVAPHSAAVESTPSSKMLPIRRLLQ